MQAQNACLACIGSWVPSLTLQREEERLINAIVTDGNESLPFIANFDHTIGQVALIWEPGTYLRLRIFGSILDPKEESCGDFGTQS